MLNIMHKLTFVVKNKKFICFLTFWTFIKKLLNLFLYKYMLLICDDILMLENVDNLDIG